MNKKYFLGLFVVLGLTSCFPQAIVKSGSLKAVGIFRNQAHEFDCDPSQAALVTGFALNLSRRPLTFACNAINTQSVLTVTLYESDKNSTQVLWIVPDPVSGGIVTLNSTLARKQRFGSNGFTFLANADWSGTFDLDWSNEAVLQGSFRLIAQ
jgi:hypothetical protein